LFGRDAVSGTISRRVAGRHERRRKRGHFTFSQDACVTVLAAPSDSSACNTGDRWLLRPCSFLTSSFLQRRTASDSPFFFYSMVKSTTPPPVLVVLSLIYLGLAGCVAQQPADMKSMERKIKESSAEQNKRVA